jgi:hypothetical protein
MEPSKDPPTGRLAPNRVFLGGGEEGRRHDRAGRSGLPRQIDLNDETREQATEAAPADQTDFFDTDFLAELEDLAHTGAGAEAGQRSISSVLHEKLSTFLASPEGSPDAPPMSEESFVGLAGPELAERTNTLLEICRQGGRQQAVMAVENFVVFFQALTPTLLEDAAGAVKRVFFHLVPTLIHISHNDFSEREEERRHGLEALRNLERILIEISHVRLAPTESELVFRSIDQLTGFIGMADYTMANDIISSQLLSIIARNRLTRALFRLMEVEVSIQKYLKEKLGHPTPQIRIPEDIPALTAYGPIQFLDETSIDGHQRLFLQVQLPDISILRDIVLHLAPESGGEPHELRLDALGSTEVSLPHDTYALGLVYKPE